MHWDPTQYARYADERGRPFVDLLARVEAVAPRRVVDLGCGPGSLTALLSSRWPGAVVEGLDSSPDMISRAAGLATDRLTFSVAAVESWLVPADADVVISNALLQWVPSHVELLRRWAAELPAGGWLAFQVPGNFGAPSHVEMRSLAASARWAGSLAGVLRGEETVLALDDYARLLMDAGLAVQAWETTYLHVLPGVDPVLEWLRGTGLRPVLAALPAAEADEFTAALASRLSLAYPPTPHGTLFPFRRLFVVGHKP
ncbi:trans-aconitate 2-methyltransferase [uncultured Jatrophihabitans sp.]|uniref:trans-aconitate 2-methyltransferase n=1 Tax=uncultured Jatrophihabitans sp. TaxID=1610747 RepID=UPI0035CC4881